MKHYKFPKISDIKTLAQWVKSRHDYVGADQNGDPIYEHTTPYPTISFKGYAKAHGTNDAIVRLADGTQYAQNRERILHTNYSEMKKRFPDEDFIEDNYKFNSWQLSKNWDKFFNKFQPKEYTAIYGEWCCGNIQSGVALSQIPIRKFLIFGIKVDGVWQDLDSIEDDPENEIYKIDRFGVYQMDIDFNDIETAKSKLKELTLAVEKCCPIGKYFGVEGTGEGIVWSADYNGEKIWFKDKGEEHKSTSSPKEKSPKEIIPDDVLSNMNEFAEMTVSKSRIRQSVSIIRGESGDNFVASKAITGKVISWVTQDIHTEELLLLNERKIEWDKVKPIIQNKAREIFFGMLDSNEF